jgi:Nuclear condensing complex subunits, C-term domain
MFSYGFDLIATSHSFSFSSNIHNFVACTSCQETRQATENLVLAWLNGLDRNPVRLLEVLDATLYETQCETVVKIILQFASKEKSSTLYTNLLQALSDLFSFQPTSETVEAIDSLSVEAIFLARIVTNEEPAMLDHLDVDVTSVTSLLEQQICQLKSQLLQDDDDAKGAASADYCGFICQQLILLSSTLASNEEGAARHMRRVLEQVLADPGTPDALISTAMQAMYSPTRSHGALLTERINETTDSVVKCIEVLQRGREENASLRDYYEIRILSIWNVLLEHVPVLSPELDKLVHEVLEPVLMDALDASEEREVEDESAEYVELIREAAVSCLGKLGLLLLVTQTHAGGVQGTDMSRVHDFRRLLVAVAMDVPCAAEIRAQGLMSLGDWGVVVEEKDGEPFLEDLDDLMLSFLDSDDPFLVCVAGEVAVKLLFSHKRLPNSKVLLARLLLLSLSADFMESQQASDGDCEIGSPNRLHQLTSYFFVAFATTEFGRNSLLGCLSSVLQSAKKTSSRIVAYVCDVVRQGLASDTATSEGECLVDTISVKAATELASFLTTSQPTGAFLLAACKTIAGFSFLKEGESMPPSPVTLPSEVYSQMTVLQSLLEELDMSIDDQRALRELGRLQETLATFRLGCTDRDSLTANDEGLGAAADDSSEQSESPSGEDDGESIAASEVPVSSNMGSDRIADCGTGPEELAHALSMTEFFASDKENDTASFEKATPTTQQSRTQRPRQKERKISFELVFEAIGDRDTSLDVSGGGSSSKPKDLPTSSRRKRSDTQQTELQTSARSSRTSSSRGSAKGTYVGDSLLTVLDDLEQDHAGASRSGVSSKSKRSR